MSRRTSRGRLWSEYDFWCEMIKRAKPGKQRRRLIRRRKTGMWIQRVRMGRDVEVERPRVPWLFVLACFAIAALWLWLAG